jgi:hypothetical protein
VVVDTGEEAIFRDVDDLVAFLGKYPRLMAVVQCPKCELRFSSNAELDDHLENDHEDPDTPEADIPHRAPAN